MSLTSAVANGPIAFLKSDGGQLLIPVTALGFDASGDLQLIDPDSAYAVALDWLKHLRDLGFIRPGATPAPSLAMVIQAADPGAWGNEIQIKVTAAGANFDLEITATTRYTAVTLGAVAGLLGTETLPGSNPGLVRFRDADLPLLLPAAATDVSLTGGVNATPVATPASTDQILRQDGDPGPAFQLAARKPGAGGNSIKVSISDVQPDAGNPANSTFTLQAAWKVTATGLNPTSLTLVDTINASFGYVVSVAPPPGGSLGAPQAGTFKLSGGADAKKASARPITQQSN